MTPTPSSVAPDAVHGNRAAKRALAALHDNLQRLNAQITDATLQPIICDSLAQYAVLRQHLDNATLSPDLPNLIVDPQVFERLMQLAGPETALELLDQMYADLQSGHQAIRAALAGPDRDSLRNQCHMLVAVAGAIGANAVQSGAELLHQAALRQEPERVVQQAQQLLGPLETLVLFVQGERRARALA